MIKAVGFCNISCKIKKRIIGGAVSVVKSLGKKIYMLNHRNTDFEQLYAFVDVYVWHGNKVDDFCTTTVKFALS